MSIQWTFVAGYLYLEIGIVIILMLPIASPRRWQQFFNSRLIATVRDRAIYFYVWLGILSLLLLDALREMRKYAHPSEAMHIQLSSEMKGNVKLFRAQRNFYITGFAIFLAFVIRRLITMILIQAELLNKSARIIQEAEHATQLAKATVVNNTVQSGGDSNVAEMKSQLDDVKSILKEEQKKTKQLQEQVIEWRLKYEEISNVKKDN